MATSPSSIARINRRNVTLHIFTSPEVGEMVNSLIVETPHVLVMVDVPIYQPFADELRAYVEGLGKPVERVLVSHAHPDHWFTLATFKDYPSYAFQEAIDEMAVLKDIALGYHTSIHADLVPREVVLPAHTIEEGEICVDGIALVLHKVTDAEATASMVVEIPSINTLLANDLVYNRCYAYVATRTAAGDTTVGHWIECLKEFEQKGYDLIIPGHGLPADCTIFARNIEYLRFAQKVLASAKNGPELVSRFKAQYPDYQLPLTLEMSAIMLYPPSAS